MGATRVHTALLLLVERITLVHHHSWSTCSQDKHSTCKCACTLASYQSIPYPDRRRLCMKHNCTHPRPGTKDTNQKSLKHTQVDTTPMSYLRQHNTLRLTDYIHSITFALQQHLKYYFQSSAPNTFFTVPAVHCGWQLQSDNDTSRCDWKPDMTLPLPPPLWGTASCCTLDLVAWMTMSEPNLHDITIHKTLTAISRQKKTCFNYLPTIKGQVTASSNGCRFLAISQHIGEDGGCKSTKL